MTLSETINDNMKTAMKSGEKKRLGVIRLIRAEIKQQEVDERITISDEQVVVLLDKMLKQRRDSITQYENAGRTELAEQEHYEVDVIKGYLPEALSEGEIAKLIDAAIEHANASSMKEMGKVIGWLKPKLQGRADMGKVSGLVKQRLS